jgi:hypothetical protein
LNAAFRNATRFAVVGTTVRIAAAANIRPAAHCQTRQTFSLRSATADRGVAGAAISEVLRRSCGTP